MAALRWWKQYIDPALAMELLRCDLYTEVFWHRLQAVLHSCEYPGVLATAGIPWTLEEIARSLPGDSDQNLGAVNELIEKNLLVKRRRNDARMSAECPYQSAKMTQDEKDRRAHLKVGVQRGSVKNKRPKNKNSDKKHEKPLSTMIYDSTLTSSSLESKGKEKEPSAGSAILVFPVVGDPENKSWVLTSTKFDEYSKSFPHLDVMQILRLARQWAIDNPAKRKTARGMPRFLLGFLANPTAPTAVAGASKASNAPKTFGQLRSQQNQQASDQCLQERREARELREDEEHEVPQSPQIDFKARYGQLDV